MNGEMVKKYLKEGKRVYSTLIASTSPRWTKFIKNTGIDFVFIDTEHIAIDKGVLSWMCCAYNAMDLAPVVRIPSPDPFIATQVMDGGASGVMAPYVETAEQVKALVGAVKYKPVKGEKLERFLNGAEKFERELAQYIDNANKNNILFINIESVTGINNLDEILKVPGLDGVVIGPHDLSCSLGIPEQYDNPVFDEAVKKILKKCHEYNVGAGMHFIGSIEKEIRWAQEAGLHLVIHSADIYQFINNTRSDLNHMKEVMGDTPGGRSESINI